MPVRLQRRRTKGWRAPEGAVYVGRGTKWGNPWRIVRHTDGTHGVINDALETWQTTTTETEARALATAEFRRWIETPNHQIAVRHACEHALIRQNIGELRGRPLMCWCPTPEPGEPDHCHAAVLLELANQPAPEGTP